MTPALFAKAYAVTLPVLLALDALWLGVVAKGFYRRWLGDLLRPDIRPVPVIAFYALYIAALLVLAVQPAVERESLGRAALLGALLGLTAYASYDLVNLATLRHFSVMVAVVDMAWGTAVSAVTAAWAYGAVRWML